MQVDLFANYQQVIFWKRTEDLLSNPKADRLISHAPIGEFLLFGVAIENSVKTLALALMARNKAVTIVADACGFWSEGTADQALRQVEAKGAKIIRVDTLLAQKLDRKVRYERVPGKVRLHGIRPELQPRAPVMETGSIAERLPLRRDAARISRRNDKEKS
jgi:hypothetical protein